MQREQEEKEKAEQVKLLQEEGKVFYKGKFWQGEITLKSEHRRPNSSAKLCRTSTKLTGLGIATRFNLKEFANSIGSGPYESQKHLPVTRLKDGRDSIGSILKNKIQKKMSQKTLTTWKRPASMSRTTNLPP